jgi:hypothetical protein
MELNNYFKIIIEGLIEVENLKTYFKRLQKVNERDNFITKIEFYTKLKNVTIDLKVKCKERFNESKNELYKVLSLKKAKNEDTKEIEKEIKTITPDMLPLNLMHITNSQLRGTLSYSQMEYVESIILEILKNEKDLINTTKQPQQKETKELDKDKDKKELHNNIFKDNSFEVWQRMFQQFEIKESSYSIDLDFMFNVMQNQESKFLIHKTITKIRMIEWINEVYEITFTKIRYTNYKSNSNKNRLIIFNQITPK